MPAIIMLFIGAVFGYVAGAALGGLAVALLAPTSVDHQLGVLMTAGAVAGPVGALVGAIVAWTMSQGRPPGFTPNPSLFAIAAGVGVASIWSFLDAWLLWPLLFATGAVDLQQPAGRMIFTAFNALPAVVAGAVTAYASGVRTPVRNALYAGLVLLVPMLSSLPVVLGAYRDVPQSPLPFVLSVVLRPLGAMIAGYVVATIVPVRHAPPASPTTTGAPMPPEPQP